ncbi:hypothetical protein PCAR4_1220011 [Paraburkholderia caribensis]|nr:hypothetical protein PCAR4_1220011 [Paraburkholderia caribensis]
MATAHRHIRRYAEPKFRRCQPVSAACGNRDGICTGHDARAAKRRHRIVQARDALAVAGAVTAIRARKLEEPYVNPQAPRAK